MAYIYSLADTWNAAGTTFTGIGLNVTDTASAAGSLLMDLQVGGSSYFTLRKDGRLEAGVAANRMIFDPATRSLILQNNAGVTNGGIRYFSSSSISMVAGSGYSSTFVDNGMLNAATGFVGWHGSAYSWEAFTPDLRLHRDAANTLAQRNSTNPQAFNLYNTYTDASNYERGFMRFVSNVLEIGTQAAGTGTNRGVTIKAGTQSWVFDAVVGTTSFPNSISLLASANIQMQSASGITFGTRGLVDFPADGVARFSRSFGVGFERIVFQDSTSAGASLKRSTTSLQARLGDDSAFTNIQGKLTTDTAYTAGAPTATGYIVLFDSTGTAYRVPAVAN